MNRERNVMIALSVALVLSTLLSLCLGAGSVSLKEAFFGDRDSVGARILFYVRLPRTLAAVLAGASLSVAGLLLQAALGNPLAAPSIIGVNSGAGLAVLCCTVFMGGGSAWTSVSAFAGACIAAFGVYVLASMTGASKTTIILAGVAVSGMLSACMDAIVTFVPDAVSNRSSFSIGGFSGVNMNQLRLALPLILAGLMAAGLLQREMEVLSLGDEVAHGLGMHVGRVRCMLLVTAAMLAGAAVSFSGLLGFVGLIAPHIARMLCRGNSKACVPVSILFGAVLCLLCDLGARLLFAPYELPVGIVLSFLGTPFFIYQLMTQKKRNRHDVA